MKACVLGAGSWGTALANVLATNGHDVVIWGRDEAVVNAINKDHLNPRYLPGGALSPLLHATTDFAGAIRDAELVLFSVPSQALPVLVSDASALISQTAVIVHAVKGFTRPNNVRISEHINLVMPNVEKRLAVLSGPSHAEEVVRGMPTTVVIASASQSTAETVQDAFMNAQFRVYTQADVVGVELGGTLKNIIALGVGLTDGLGLGDNTKAALMTRGLAEITRLGVSLGASPLTFSGLAGIGDLIVTCTSNHSRNFRTGRLLATGLALNEALEQIGMAVEGVSTTFAAAELAQTHQVDMPITTALKCVLKGDVTPGAAVRELMQRERSHEMEDVGQRPLTHHWRFS
ncbi:NAD(P)H-dependent glycerol-3-phosphate dehydrogenase [Alicyclobacillus fodiniaquatilis]|uniref:Glycerol-3-phosphate dehydrogenase [NAD(P)+] n=1 Tax=Alicyclobacillus fodiniaquatilis TaxID=1661150 RepID=A0ABW4JPP4_9BACL